MLTQLTDCNGSRHQPLPSFKFQHVTIMTATHTTITTATDLTFIYLFNSCNELRLDGLNRLNSAYLNYNINAFTNIKPKPALNMHTGRSTARCGFHPFDRQISPQLGCSSGWPLACPQQIPATFPNNSRHLWTAQHYGFKYKYVISNRYVYVSIISLPAIVLSKLS